MNTKNIDIKLLEGKYAVCQLDDTEEVPTWAKGGEFLSITRTSEELSIVTLEENVPETIKTERDWRVLQVEGQLDFSLVGILAGISSVLAKKAISIFVISTFNTDYILVKDDKLKNAIGTLVNEGYGVK